MHSPISAARAVMEKSPHVDDRWAAARMSLPRASGLKMEEPSYFFTESRWQGLVKQLKKEGLPIPPRPAGVPPEGETDSGRDA